MTYDDTVYVVGQSKTNSDNAITAMFNSFFIGFVINIKTDEIVDIGCSHTIDVTENILKNILIGKKCTDNFSKLESEIMRRYHGSSQKAILVSCKEAFKQYDNIKKKYY